MYDKKLPIVTRANSSESNSNAAEINVKLHQKIYKIIVTCIIGSAMRTEIKIISSLARKNTSIHINVFLL